ncbi:hypothetical protein K1T71_001351 [Dendrolimus kikuchii]|uniref:Uncharacterized protein n=1 Tax=Dendrolimus kikuchii TaxID=765133 RepID=A0ACC1DHJ8_9NEOP|nr:hypothetical protein K1T71_001351 [Dendrolimus kikuchii]
MPDRSTVNLLASAMNPQSVVVDKEMTNFKENCVYCNPNEDLCHIQLKDLVKLKDSTRKLLCLLEEIQSKTHSKNMIPNNYQFTELMIQPISNKKEVLSVTDVIGCNALKRLESQAKNLDAIYIEDEEDDCSIYKRLTRKCICLNQLEYNDFVIHFNEDTKYFTSNIGEIIKNMRILKKFLYMSGSYTKNALLFISEGLSSSSPREKVEIAQACAHADICNLFEDHSIVAFCISWPCKYENYGDSTTQILAAGVLQKLSLLDEGRRYLKFSSKITNDIKKLLRKKSSNLNFDILESLNATLNLLHPPIAQHVNVTYYCKPSEEGFATKTIKALVQYRQYMTLDEVFTHLDLLQNLSNNDLAKSELTLCLPTIFSLFKHLLMEYDNSEMNIIVTNILNNIVSNNMVKEKDMEVSKLTDDTVTKKIKMKNEMVQISPRKNAKKIKKSKIGVAAMVQNTCLPASGNKKKSTFISAESKNPVIVVPMEE